MKVVTSQDFIAENIAQIQGILKNALKKNVLRKAAAQLTFPAYVNCQTGAVLLPDGEPKEKQYYKTVRLRVVYLQEQDEAKIEILDEKSDVEFRCEGISLAACQMLEQTMRIFNFAIKSFHPTTDMQKVIQHLAKMQFQVVPVKVAKNIAQEAWYDVNRVQAEKLLSDCIAGTYLFRRGEYVGILEKELSESLGEKVECITLTFIGDQNRISDLTLVKTAKGWHVYDDDPKLEGEIYSSLSELLDKQNSLINFPLVHLKAA